MNRFSIVILFLFVCINVEAQSLKPGFDEEEYKQMVLIFSTTTGDSMNYVARYGYPEGYEKKYRSKPMGLDNLWEMWVNEERKVGVISIRGSTEDRDSWILNLYSSMIPAKGQISWRGEAPVDYYLSDDADASVHVGWTVGMAFIYRDMIDRLKELHEQGIKEFIITGHSQGGVISILLTAQVLNMQAQGEIPADIRFKTYASAAPKPGNRAFAESYDKLVKNGWAFNVINAADWVPEVPMAVDTYDDFDHSNPLSHAKSLITGQQPLRRAILSKVHQWVETPTKDLIKFYDRTIGEMTNQTVQHKIPGLNVPQFDTCLTYVSAGKRIVFYPDEPYYEIFERKSANTFKHHDRRAYLYLLTKNGEYINDFDKVGEEWKLYRIDGKDYRYYFKDEAPTVVISNQGKRVSGKVGCSFYQCNVNTLEKRMEKEGPLVVTETLCHGHNEEVFLESMQRVDSYKLKGEELHLMHEGHVLMIFRK